VFGLAFACTVELLLAGWRIVRKGRADRARFESDLRAIRSEVEHIAAVGTSTRTKVAAIGDTVVAATEGMRSQLGNLHDRAEGLGDRVSEVADRIETLSEQVDVAKSLTQPVNALRRDVAEIKQIAGQLEKRVASIETNFADLQTHVTLIENSMVEITRAPNGEGNGRAGRDIDPGKRGGGPRKPDGGNGERSNKPSPPRPQLVARRDTGDWQIYVDVEHEETANLRIVQREAELNQANGEEPRIFGPLLDLRSPIKTRRNGSEAIESALITEDNPPFIFRMVQDGFARSVRHPSSGLNLAVVPTDWRYNAVASGSPPVEPEPLGIPGYTVHYYSPDDGTALAFELPNDEPFKLTSSRSQFRLHGQQQQDAEPRMGPLFIGDPPTLQIDPEAPMEVQTIVIGEEGRGSGKWRRTYDQDVISTGSWSEDIRSHAIGWYFVRLYDTAGDLIDSLDFRYVRGLRSISLQPDAGNRVNVVFTHDESVSVQPSDAVSSILLGQPATSQRGSTTFVLRRDPSIREAQFQLMCRGRTIRVSADIDTIWWARVDPSCQNEPDWHSASIELTLSDFEANSNIELWIRVPRSTSDTALFGFDIDGRRNIGARRLDGSWVIPLYERSEAPELTRIGNHTLHLWLRNDEGEKRTDVAKVKVFKKCPWCEECGTDPDSLAAHLLAKHHDRLFERLVLHGGGATSADRRSGLVCLECRPAKFFPASLLPDEYPMTLLERHSNNLHRGRVSYKKINNIYDLPGGQEKWIWKCKLASNHAIIPPAGDENALSDKKAHVKEHLFELLLQP